MATMDLDRLKALRPADDSAAAIAASIAAAKRESAAAAAVAAEFERKLAEGLLTSSNEEIESLEHALARAKRQIERLGVFAEALERDLVEARKRERVAQVTARVEEANAQTRLWAQRFRLEYPALAQQLAALLEEEQRVAELGKQATTAVESLKRLGEADGVPAVLFPGSEAGADHWGTQFGRLVRLPSVKGETGVNLDPPAYWYDGMRPNFPVL